MLGYRLKELDSLRGIAALSVAFFHFTEHKPPFRYFKYGGTAVDLFFMISGFVIFLSVADNPSWKIFLKRRFLRLYPTYWVCLIITTIVIIINHYLLRINDKHLTGRFLANLTMLQYYFNIGDIDGPYWTLAVELMFYVMILVLLMSNALNKIIIVSYVILISLAITRFYVIPYHPYVYDSINSALPLIIHYPFFFAGIMFYKLKDEGGTLGGYLALVICFLLASQVFKYSSRAANYLSATQYCFILLIYFSIFLLLINGWLAFLKVKLLLFLGKISFAFYLIHQYIGRYFLLNKLINIYKINYWIGVSIALLFSIGLASVITYRLDRRVRLWLDKYLSSNAVFSLE